MTAEEASLRIRRCAEELVLAARSDPAAAEKLVREMEHIAGQNREPLFEAYSERAKGHLLHIRGSIPEAVQRYRAALVLFEMCHEEIEGARTASTLVGALVPLGEFDEALSLAEQARQIFQRANLQNRAARLDVNVGNLYHRLNRLEDALLRYERAAPFLENSEDREAAAGLLINRSVILMLLHRFDDAHEGFLRARAFTEKHGLAVLASQTEHNRAYLLFLIGNYTQAIKFMQVAEAGFQRIGDEVHVAHCRLDRAEILLELNLPETAHELAELAEAGFRSSGLNGDRARSLLLVGRCLLRLGRTGEAVTHYKKARHLFEAEGNAIWASMAELEIAAALMASGKTDEAAGMAERAGESFRSQNHLPFSALADALSARLYLQRDDANRALFFLNRCEKSLNFQPPACIRYHVEYLKGRAFELQGKLTEARDSFRAATVSLEFLLTHISADQAMVRFLEDKDDVYERLAGLSHDVHQAFEWVDRARTRALTTSWNSSRRSNQTPDKVRNLRESLRSDYLELFRANDVHPVALFEKITRSERRLMQELLEDEFNQSVSTTDPPHFEALNLSAEEVLLEYFIRDDQVSVFVVKDGLLKYITLPISMRELQEEVNFARNGLCRPGNSRREPALRYHLERLYQALIEPLRPFLCGRIIIIPHRFLHHLPFQVLLGPTGYLAEEFIVSYAPSTASYALASRKQCLCTGTSLIIGAQSADLPAAMDEVRDVGSKLPNSEIAINKSLQEIRTAFETATFIHIAAHGLFRSDNPTGSLLNLGSDVLTPADMLDLKVNAELITMSACSTGQTYVRGNEVQGFVRAFSQWAVPSLVASLWEINDRATSMLMSSFYTRIQDSPDIAENLRCAMLDVKREFAHPYYWGGFVLIGKQKLGTSWECIKRISGRPCTDSSGNGT